MEGHIKLNIAIALLTDKIAEVMRKKEEVGADGVAVIENDTELEAELEKLLEEREELYKGNEEVIEKILKEYKTIT